MKRSNEASDINQVQVDAIVQNGRLVQLFPYGETNEEHCVHGIKLRWSCTSCEEMFEDRKTELE